MKRFKKVLGVVVCVAVLLGVFSLSVSANEALQPTLTVAGNASVTVVPDVAIVTFSIRTLADDPVASQEQNRARSNEIYAALEAIGIRESEIQTQWYNIRRHYDWETSSEMVPVEWDWYGNPIRFAPNPWGEPVFAGYETFHSVAVTLNNVDVDASMVGRVLDVSIAHGANMAGGFHFTLSPERRETSYLEALAIATTNARSRAETVAGPLGISNLRPIVINIENVRVNIPGVAATIQDSWGWDVSFSQAEMRAGSSANVWFDDVQISTELTPISPGEVSVFANVSIIFTF